MNFSSKISALLIGGLLLTACSAKTGQPSAEETDPGANGERPVVPVRTISLAKTQIARTIDYTATVLPYEEVNVAPSTPGRIEKIYVESGDRISKGDELFLMDRTQLYQLQLQLASLEKDLARLDTLLRTGSVKQQQYDQMKTQYDVTKTNVDFMEQNTLLKSPFNGIVTGKYFEDGEMYSGAPTTSTGRSAIVTVMQINPLKLDVNVSEQYYPLVKRGMKATVTADVYGAELFSGAVSRIAPVVNSVTRSFVVEIELPNRNELLKPGMFVRVSMELGEVETFVVPANTVLVQEGTNQRYIFVADNGTAKRVGVLIGKRFDDSLEILSDELKAGDLVITDGQSRLISGDKIEVVR
jgi:RND family efflux transporter MFP subunit